ncbi:sphingoid long chain base kinase [Schistosoma mansoni]|uniref:sphingoid long chain base kinase n=1 Tax=Schistosoma mansoni TaxID=6183 RepID=UPI00022DCB7E|nr:sphingoid long chain base kinase [Schistosoma mansoni]|eukprot:XP_018655048.1 sphingoid long chain base kinase [Schistosoma mansoni]
MRCTLYLNELGICVVPNHYSLPNKMYIHKNLIIGCKKEIILKNKKKQNVCLKMSYFKTRKVNGKKENLKILEETNLDILFSSDQEASECMKAMEFFVENAHLSDAKPYLVLINPKSGSGNALNGFNYKVSPIWKQMNVPYELFCTEYPGHAENFIINLPKANLLRYRAIVTCSGDGLVYEVINGLISRKDYDDVIEEDTIPIGILPGGSANSTAASICYHSGCTLPVLPRITPVSCIHFGTYDTNFHRYGIQSIEWGFIADLDYKKKPTYRAKLSYLPFDNVLYQKNKYKNDELVQKSSVSSTECENSSDLTDKLNESPQQIKKSHQSWSFLPETNQHISNHQDKWVTLDKKFVTILVLNHSHITSSAVMYPDAHMSDPYLNLLILHENTTREEKGSYHRIHTLNVYDNIKYVTGTKLTVYIYE